jgi:hypothetical protein
MTVNSSQVVTFAQNPVFPDGGVAVADLDIDGATDIGAAIVDADLLIIDDGAGGTNRKTAASRLKTYIGGGITEYDVWRLTADITATNADITANLERCDDTLFEKIGTGMSVSSGIFSFPSTGKWVVSARPEIIADQDDNTFLYLYTTGDNSTYDYDVRTGSTNLGGDSTDGEAFSYLDYLLDVTNVSNVKCKFTTGSFGANSSLFGNTDVNRTYFTFTRIGDT